MQLQRRALAIRDAALPDDDPDLAEPRGPVAEAEGLLRRVAATTEKVYGPEHPELARTLVNLGL